MRLIPYAAVVAAALSVAACASDMQSADNSAASAASSGTAAAATAGTTTPMYIAEAGRSDLYEIESSRLALEKASSPQVKSMAQMLITDHTNSTTMVQAAAKAANIPTPPPTIDPRRSAMVNQLRGLSGAAFDSAYLAQQQMAHEEALTLHQTYASNGEVSQLRTAASQIVPVVQHHLQMVTQLRSGGGM